jgi:RimJ/RimL family protein N-acetyltransferase
MKDHPDTLKAGDLVLRPWRPEDRAPFAALNADPEVMRHFPSMLSVEASDALADGIEAALARDGWGLWALDAPEMGFVGFVGLARPNFTAWFTSPDAPALEVGWRLARSAWGHGWATRAALEALRFAFTELGRDDVVSFTTVANEPSRRVMEKLGLAPVPGGDFDHPRCLAPELERVRRHVIYRIDAATFEAHETDPGLRRLARHVGSFNTGVRTGDWSSLIRGCTDDVMLELVGVPAPSVSGRAAVEAAYRADPPTGEIKIADARRDGDEAVAEWRMLAAGSERMGELRLRLRDDHVARMLVSFDL